MTSPPWLFLKKLALTRTFLFLLRRQIPLDWMPIGVAQPERRILLLHGLLPKYALHALRQFPCRWRALDRSLWYVNVVLCRDGESAEKPSHALLEVSPDRDQQG